MLNAIDNSLTFNSLKNKYNEKFMNILFKNKIAFKNGGDLSAHLNKIDSNILGAFNRWKGNEII